MAMLMEKSRPISMTRKPRNLSIVSFLSALLHLSETLYRSDESNFSTSESISLIASSMAKRTGSLSPICISL